MGVKTTVGQVALVGGGLYDQPGNILVDERASLLARGRGRGSLYILIEVSGPDLGRDIITSQLIQAMRRAYYGWRGSVTAGLREAVREANGLLFEENRNSLPTERRTAGVSCAVLRDDDLFIAQAGPAALYLDHEGEMTRCPDESPWLDGTPPEDADAAPLGQRRDLNVDLFHSKMSDGDTILLADSELARSVAPWKWQAVLSRTPVGAVLEDLLATGARRDLSVLVVRLAEEAVRKVPIQPPVVEPEVPEMPRPEPQPIEEIPVLPVVQPIAQEVLPPEPQLGEEVQILPAVETDVQPIVEPAEPEMPRQEARPPRERLSERVPEFHIGERLRAVRLALAAGLASLWGGLLTLLRRMMPERAEPQPSQRAQFTTLTEVGKAPKKRRRERAAAERRTDPVQRLLIGVAIAIPVIVAVIVLVTFVQRGQAQRAELEVLWQQANAQWEQADTVTDPETTRAHLTEAQRLVGEYLERRSDHVDALDLKEKIEARLDVINQVKRISSVDELNSYPADANLTRVVVQGAHIFVMDRQNSRVYHHQLDEEVQKALHPDTREIVLVSKGDQVGDVLVGDLVDMVWMPPGPNRQKASLLILESGGALLDYDPATGQLVSLRVAASDMWQFAKLVGSHSGRFYVLDSSASKIWRYDPTPDGYSTPPTGWLQTEVDLAGVVDMAIGDSIYLLYADGGMRKFTVGEPSPFDISDWDTPPSSPSALFTRPPEETRWIYVADRGNGRIVQSSKEGRFEQQFRLTGAQVAENGDALAGATDLFVDEIVGNAYLLSGQKLYLLNLPMSD